jgi:hypothetical protein
VASESDRILLVGLMASIAAESAHVASVTYNGVALTRLLRRSQPSLLDGDLWYLINPDTGTHNVVATHDETPSDFAGVSVGYRNVHQTTPFGNSGTTGGTAAPMTQDVSSATDELVVDVLAFAVAGGVTVGGGQTQRGNQLEASVWGAAMSEEAGASTVTMSWTGASVIGWSSLVASMRGPAAAASGIVFNLQIG